MALCNEEEDLEQLNAEEKVLESFVVVDSDTPYYAEANEELKTMYVRTPLIDEDKGWNAKVMAQLAA